MGLARSHHRVLSFLTDVPFILQTGRGHVGVQPCLLSAGPRSDDQGLLMAAARPAGETGVLGGGSRQHLWGHSLSIASVLSPGRCDQTDLGLTHFPPRSYSSWYQLLLRPSTSPLGSHQDETSRCVLGWRKPCSSGLWTGAPALAPPPSRSWVGVPWPGQGEGWALRSCSPFPHKAPAGPKCSSTWHSTLFKGICHLAQIKYVLKRSQQH